ncbi:hypothetical protein BVC93_18520 [Mycobacterium sp. MS1601]|uniref:diguanylate cyclase domain-containing protein n=1 Tax=Mycobacterium sp. MS1601 TaxID=1936029 RepID=UPI0009792815|nr:diguanylate cyclase [Mycobacterium sp. MS1601]AQA04094.1 hypothetical protein BVC93_18520 [Mycobacterium sp. MS1601]
MDRINAPNSGMSSGCTISTARFPTSSWASVIVHVTDAVLPESAVALADRLLDALAAPLPLGSTTVAIGLSIGIAVAPGSGVEAEALLRAADDAMYGAKMAGRNCYRVGDEPR